jgi:hypothetical protein
MKAKAEDSAAQNDVSPRPQQTFYAPDGSGTEADREIFDSTTMTQFDPYLSALGLMPNSAWPMANFGQEGGAMAGGAGAGFGGFPAQGQAMGFDGGFPVGLQSDNTVQNWFSGSRYLMNLMEDDIQMPDFNGL